MKPIPVLFAILVFFSISMSAEEPNLEEAKVAFTKADADLNKAYQEVKALLPEWLFDELRAGQKEWLEYRDASALSAAVFNGGPENEGKETTAPEYWESMTWSTETRTRMILGWKVKGEGGAGEVPWKGIWTDGYGGWLLIEEILDPRRFRFSLHVVRGPTAHVGGISGNARRNREAGFFSDEGDADYHNAEDKTETWLFFDKEFGAPRIKVRGIHTQPYHGARAYFDGTYTRLGDATDEDREMFEEP